MNLFGNGRNIEDMLHGLIRIGKVCDIDYAKGAARVVFFDDDSLVSSFLQVIQRNTYENQDYAMPDIGEVVVCIFLSSGLENGFILGSVYAKDVVPQETNGDKRSVVFNDETKISYDRNTHELEVTIEGTSFKANRDGVEVITPKNANVTAPAVSIEGEVTITGNVTITGTVTASGDVTGSGISLAEHTHTIQGSSISTPI